MARVALRLNHKDETISEKQPLFNLFCIKLVVTSVGLILFYFSLSIGLTFYQRWLLKVTSTVQGAVRPGQACGLLTHMAHVHRTPVPNVHSLYPSITDGYKTMYNAPGIHQHMQDSQDFHFPLTVVTCHLVIKFVLATLCRQTWEACTGNPRVLLGWKNYVKRVAATGIASGLDVGLSNWGLELITVSLYTMTKSTVIIFILGFALFYKLEEKSWTLVLIVSMISGGLFLFTYKATQFDMFGFLLILAASFSSGLRWTLAQLVMQKSKLGLQNPIDMVYHVQPWMIIAVFPFAVGFEGTLLASSCKLFRYQHALVLFYALMKIVLGALIAFLMEVSEFMVVNHTSSLTLSVAGIFKEVCALVLAVEWSGDKMNMVNVIGLLCCMGGIVFHVLHKISAASHRDVQQREDRYQEERMDLQVPLLGDTSAAAVAFSSGYATTSDGSDDESSNVLFSVLQRRDK